jgi:hypothetical protein
MSKIEAADLVTLRENFQERLFALQESLCKEIVAGLEGRQIRVSRKFKGPGELWTLHEIDVTVDSARIGYDDELVLVGTYAHPHNGKLQSTEVTP